VTPLVDWWRGASVATRIAAVAFGASVAVALA
jgi:hypothetical protein